MSGTGAIKKTLRIVAWILVTLVVPAFAAVVVIEATVRYQERDWKFIEKTLYYQTKQARMHAPDPNPEIMYRLRPGQYMYFSWVTVNSLGARSPERPTQKPEGVFRIAVLGASNSLGAPSIPDDQTWPWQLESFLNNEGQGKYEVWNFSANAYVGSQIAKLGHLVVDQIDPDLVILNIGNTGQRPFLGTAPVKHYFERHPELWLEYFPDQALESVKWLSRKNTLWMIEHSSVFRLYLASHTVKSLGLRPWISSDHEAQNVKAISEFIERHSDGPKICMFFGPYQNQADYINYTANSKATVFALSADGLPDDYKKAHPPAEVYRWYGENIANILKEKGLVPAL